MTLPAYTLTDTDRRALMLVRCSDDPRDRGHLLGDVPHRALCGWPLGGRLDEAKRGTRPCGDCWGRR